MATTVFNTPPAVVVPPSYLCSTASGGSTAKPRYFSRVSFVSSRLPVIRCRVFRDSRRSGVKSAGRPVLKFAAFAANGETVDAKAETQVEDRIEGSESDSEAEVEWDVDGGISVDSSGESNDTVAEAPTSAVLAYLNLYKEALTNNDEAKAIEVESFLKTLEDEKNELEKKVLTLSDELSSEKVRVLRISADFDNFRKRTERERLSLVSNAQGEVVESLVPVLDNFERAKTQIKVETEGEEKINNSYQSISKQFGEILASLGVVTVETVGKPFDPMLHEAIMREDSTEFEDGIILEEYRKGFQLGDRLLRPSMVKVSSGPGPAKPKTEEGQAEDEKEPDETSEPAEE